MNFVFIISKVLHWLMFRFICSLVKLIFVNFNLINVLIRFDLSRLFLTKKSL